jgi:hypothetical protein
MIKIYKPFIPTRVKYSLDVDLYMYIGRNADEKSYEFDSHQMGKLYEFASNLLQIPDYEFTPLCEISHNKEGCARYIYQPMDKSGKKLPRFEVMFRIKKADYSKSESEELNTNKVQIYRVAGEARSDILKYIYFMEDICDEISRGNYVRLRRR